jgi:hypothetical protein
MKKPFHYKIKSRSDVNKIFIEILYKQIWLQNLNFFKSSTNLFSIIPLILYVLQYKESLSSQHLNKKFS